MSALGGMEGGGAFIFVELVFIEFRSCSFVVVFIKFQSCSFVVIDY